MKEKMQFRSRIIYAIFVVLTLGIVIFNACFDVKVDISKKALSIEKTSQNWPLEITKGKTVAEFGNDVVSIDAGGSILEGKNDKTKETKIDGVGILKKNNFGFFEYGENFGIFVTFSFMMFFLAYCICGVVGRLDKYIKTIVGISVITITLIFIFQLKEIEPVKVDTIEGYKIEAQGDKIKLTDPNGLVTNEKGKAHYVVKETGEDVKIVATEEHLYTKSIPVFIILFIYSTLLILTANSIKFTRFVFGRK